MKQAKEYIEQSPLYFIYVDDFNISDIENLAKKYVYQYQIEIFVFDYIQDSIRLSLEIRQQSATPMQEYQRLLIFATRMKTMAEHLGIQVLSGTQLTAAESREASVRIRDFLLDQRAW